jgi:hypothetical protein
VAPHDVAVPANRGVPAEAVPSPELVAAWFVLGQARLERVPWWAAHWLLAGRDGQSLRELAGLNGRDPHEVRDLLPAALAEMSVALPPTAVAAAVVVFDDLARRCLAGEAGERWVVQVVEDVVTRTGYSFEVAELPLGRLHGFDDEWGAGWGRTVEELKAAIRAACAEQFRM